MAQQALPGVRVEAPAIDGAERVLTGDALAFLVDLERRFRAERQRLLALRVERQARLDAGELPDFLPETSAVRNGEWKVAPIPADLQDRRVEITGPVDRKMVVNALNSGASCFMADFEDFDHAHLVQPAAGAAEPGRRHPPADRLRGPAERQVVPAGRAHGRAAGPPARLASLGEARDRGRRADVGLAVRFRALPLPQRQGAAGARQRPLFLSAEDGEPSRGPALEQRVPARAGSARHPGRLDQGHGADRDHPRHLRARRDPLRAARSHGGPELRPLGLYLQLHQEAAELPEPPAARPGAGDDDRTLHARLQPARDPDLPSPRCPCDGRHGGPDPDQGGQGPERGGAGQGPRRQGARGQRRA